MSEIKQLPTRDEVPTPLTWDLTKIFKDDAAFDVAYNQLIEELNQAESFKGTLGDGAEAFLAALEYVLDVYRKVETLYVYSHLKNDQDTTNTAYQALYARASSLYAQVSEAVSWFDPEVLTLSDEQIWGYFEEQPKLAVYRHYIQNILDDKTNLDKLKTALDSTKKTGNSPVSPSSGKSHHGRLRRNSNTGTRYQGIGLVAAYDQGII